MRADRGHNHGMVFLRCEARDGDRADDSDFCNSNGVERNVPPDRDIHLVIDNAGTHKTKLIRDWFAKRPRWHIHFTPTSASWINQVERFFALLTEKQIRRGVHRSTQALEADIQAHIDAHNAEPKPFRRTKSADDILAAIIRFCLLTLQGDALQRTSESGTLNSISGGLHALLQRKDIIIAGHHRNRLVFEALGQMHRSDGDTTLRLLKPLRQFKL